MNPICSDRRRQRVGFQNPNGPAYDVVLSMCSSLARFPAPWQNVPPPVDARGPILDGAAALKKLARQFTPEMLHDAGILRQAADGSDELAPELVNRTGAILPLRYAANGLPMDLLSAGGCLALTAHPLEDVLRDHWTRNRIAESGLLIATPSIHDVLLLRALGFPATCTAGMATVARPEAKAMIDDLNGVNVSAAWPARFQLDLILPTWQVAGMDERPPDGLTDIATRLAALQGDLNLALFAVSAWTMDARRLASLRLAVDMCSPADLSTLLAGSMTTERFADA
jgi:hypothetical protein